MLVGNVNAKKLELDIEPTELTPLTIIAYDVPAANPVNVADVDVLEAGVTVKPSRVYVNDVEPTPPVQFIVNPVWDVKD